MLELSNKEKAINDANQIDHEIIQALEQGKSFRVEAGAGSGKTYSLNKVIDWIQENKWDKYTKKHQQVACLTYTNVAVEVIKSRLKKNSFVLPSTIHAFAWQAIKQYQKILIGYIIDNVEMHPKEGDVSSINSIKYELGSKYIENGVLFISHSDVIKLFVTLLNQAKFRLVFASKYPVILIDEYQDSFKSITDKFIEYFISQNKGPQFGFFGDAWQTIYQANKPCGLIEDRNLLEIKKTVNFRSAPKIVDLLNIIRPNLPQISAIDELQGEAIVVHCNDYEGVRRIDRNFKGELPSQEIDTRLTKVEAIFNSDSANSKTLMITHRMLAERQGYDVIFKILDNKFRDNDEKVLTFFSKKIEPIFNSLLNAQSGSLFQALGIANYPIKNKSDKLKWKKFQEELKSARQKNAIDVLKVVYDYGLIPTESIDELYRAYSGNKDSEYYGGTIGEYLNVPYTQFLAAIAYHQPESIYSTEHGVKGEEYDNVIFVISKGWNQYQFDVYAPMLLTGVTNGKVESFERNRNLFYVCCSRPRKKLLIFVTTEVDETFENFLKTLVGSENYFSCNDFMKKTKL